MMMGTVQVILWYCEVNTIIITLLCDPGRYHLQYCGDIHNLGTGDHSLLISLFHATWRLGPSVPASWPGTSCTDGNHNSSFASQHRQNLDVTGSYSSYFYHRATGGTQIDWHQSCMWTKSSNECVGCRPCCHVASWQFAPLHHCSFAQRWLTFVCIHRPDKLNKSPVTSTSTSRAEMWDASLAALHDARADNWQIIRE